jgi:protein gp37
MGTDTKIEYVDVSWNPITGCLPELPCWVYCWARKMALRQRGRNGYPANTPFAPTFHRERLAEPQFLKRPKRIAVSFMGDLWNRGVRVDDRCAVIRATNLAPQHTYVFLTKRIERAADEIEWLGSSNFWFGTSIEDQPTAEERLSHLARCRAAIRWVSVEPMQGPVDLSPWLMYLDWVVAGGGPFQVHPDWIRRLRDQCHTAHVPFFFKQWGDWIPISQTPDGWLDANSTPRKPTRRDPDPSPKCRFREYTFGLGGNPGPVQTCFRVGKKVAGRSLDGREWSQFPACTLVPEEASA